MAYTTIDDPSAYFQIALYTGNSSTNVITNDGNSDLQADMIWLKERSSTSGHHIFDSTRGVGGSGKALIVNSTNAEGDDAAFTSFDTDGFTLANTGGFNESGITNVAWQWKANGGTTSSNTDGSITSTVQANTTAGFSIVTWTADGGGAKTVGHGLGAVPKMIITKNRTDGSTNWQIYHASNTSAPETEVIYFTTGATQDYDGFMADTAPTSSVFTAGGDGSMNGTSGKNIIAYCFAEIQGYSKFGSYTGNGSTDGTFVYTGFKPAWLLLKNTTDTGDDWHMFDSTRDTFNVADARLKANDTGAEATDTALDFLSNGFKLRNTSNARNGSGDTIIYMAFAEHPFVSSEGVPTTAR